MKLAPQYIEELGIIEESGAFAAPSTAETCDVSSDTGREPGRRIPLGHGYFALVDAEDFERINTHKWHLKRKKSQPGKLYAQRTIRLGTGRSAPKSTVVMHREVMNAAPGVQIDHRFGDGLDNRKANLRTATNQENQRNICFSKRRKAGGFKGVSWNRNAGKWEAGIGAGEPKPNGKRARIYLGIFDDAADAARAYDAAARKYFGEFAGLNFPVEARKIVESAIRGSEFTYMGEHGQPARGAAMGAG